MAKLSAKSVRWLTVGLEAEVQARVFRWKKLRFETVTRYYLCKGVGLTTALWVDQSGARVSTDSKLYNLLNRAGTVWQLNGEPNKFEFTHPITE